MRNILSNLRHNATDNHDDGVPVKACALFEAMDGKNARDYEERVEPSVGGGRKLAELLGH